MLVGDSAIAGTYDKFDVTVTEVLEIELQKLNRVAFWFVFKGDPAPDFSGPALACVDSFPQPVESNMSSLYCNYNFQPRCCEMERFL